MCLEELQIVSLLILKILLHFLREPVSVEMNLYCLI